MPLPKSFLFSQATWISLRQKLLSIHSLVITGFLWSLCFSLILPLPWVLVPVQTKFILQYAFIFLLLNRTIWKPTRHFKQQYYVFLWQQNGFFAFLFSGRAVSKGSTPACTRMYFFNWLHTKLSSSLALPSCLFVTLLSVNYIYNSLYMGGRNRISSEIYFISHVAGK